MEQTREKLQLYTIERTRNNTFISVQFNTMRSSTLLALLTFQGLKSFLKGPSFLSFAASVRARNLLNPVVAAPRPNAAALVRTSSLDAISPTVGLVIVGAGGVLEATGGADGETEGCVIPGPCLLKSSSMLC